MDKHLDRPEVKRQRRAADREDIVNRAFDLTNSSTPEVKALALIVRAIVNLAATIEAK